MMAGYEWLLIARLVNCSFAAKLAWNITTADENTGQHLVPHIQQPQYIQQDDGSQYFIQQQSPQQVFYANIQQPQPNVNRIIQHQNQQKVRKNTFQ
jgi:hypothetical protein